LVFQDSTPDSEKKQTIVHELAHFNTIGVNEKNSYSVIGEEDLGYGEDNCKAMAKKKIPHRP
jgi:hypothetical protein